jgi:hypothetical protein
VGKTRYSLCIPCYTRNMDPVLQTLNLISLFWCTLAHNLKHEWKMAAVNNKEKHGLVHTFILSSWMSYYRCSHFSRNLIVLRVSIFDNIGFSRQTVLRVYRFSSQYSLCSKLNSNIDNHGSFLTEVQQALCWLYRSFCTRKQKDVEDHITLWKNKFWKHTAMTT